MYTYILFTYIFVETDRKAAAEVHMSWCARCSISWQQKRDADQDTLGDAKLGEKNRLKQNAV